MALLVGNWFIYILIIHIVYAILLLPIHEKNNIGSLNMNEKPFLEKTLKPVNNNIKKVLAATFPYYDQLMEMTQIFSKNWNYSKSSGWMQKVYDNKKALFYFIPLNNQFEISLTVRDDEREIFLKDKNMEFHKEQLQNAKKYSEGFAMLLSFG
jgi:Protein of unknown function (DUF3788)